MTVGGAPLVVEDDLGDDFVFWVVRARRPLHSRGRPVLGSGWPLVSHDGVPVLRRDPRVNSWSTVDDASFRPSGSHGRRHSDRHRPICRWLSPTADISGLWSLEDFPDQLGQF